MPAIREPLTNEDLWRLGADDRPRWPPPQPWWEPGTRHAYHTNTYGHLIGEVVRRVSGEPCGRRLAAVAGPLEADVYVGVPVTERRRCAEVLFDAPGPDHPLDDTLDGGRPHGDAELLQPAGVLVHGGGQHAGVARGAEVPSTNGHGSAAWRGAPVRRVARSPAVCSRPDLLAEATSPQSQGYCPILHEDVTFGLGFKPTMPRRPFGPNPRSFGHFGTGGAVGFADPDAGVAFGYVMNDVIPRWQSTRNRSLIDALYGRVVVPARRHGRRHPLRRSRRPRPGRWTNRARRKSML